jgi:hypothetical protein
LFLLGILLSHPSQHAQTIVVHHWSYPRFEDSSSRRLKYNFSTFCYSYCGEHI